MITKDMTIGEVIKMKANAPEILMGFGMGCVGCPSAQAECIEDAAEIHGINLTELLEALNDLNSAIKKLENVQCLENKLDKAFQKYVKCVHKENNSCEC